jgi:hypothetical protein
MASKYQSVASTVLYSGVSPSSGKRLGSMPWSTKWAKVRRMRLDAPEVRTPHGALERDFGLTFIFAFYPTEARPAWNIQ